MLPLCVNHQARWQGVGCGSAMIVVHFPACQGQNTWHETEHSALRGGSWLATALIPASSITRRWSLDLDARGTYSQSKQTGIYVDYEHKEMAQ